MATAGDLRDRMKRRMPEFRRADATEDARLLDQLSDAQEHVVSRVNDLGTDVLLKSCTWSTTADERRYELPADFDGLRYVERVIDDTVGQSRPLYRIQYLDGKERLMEWTGDGWEPFVGYLDLSGSNGVPLAYVLSGEWYEFRPIPDAVYSMRTWYQRRLDRFTANTDTVTVPEALHEAIVLRACMFERVYRHQQTKDLRQLYEEELSGGLMRLEDWAEDGPLFVQHVDVEAGLF